ncbi:hypothetical protein IL306_014399 [Fusarium sp. DS 682]|nr:hypothetical protein IL306_014399 [Fusarium sp. DS 682]
MCYIQVIHMTACDTRRPAIINTITGETVYHPLEPPQHCEHYHRRRSSPCPYHGDCCSPGQIFICDAQGPRDQCRGSQAYHLIVHPYYKYTSGLLHQMEPIVDWNRLEERTDIYAYEEDIRCDFFDLGALMFELADDGNNIVEYLMGNLAKDHEEEVDLFLEHGELYEQWTETCEQFIANQEAWEGLAGAGCMEVCPAWLRQVHPWTGCFQPCPVWQREFRQFEGIPFSFVENVENQDGILRFHPYYAQSRSPRQAVRREAPWRSPARPHERSPEVEERIRLQNERYPGQWGVVFDEIARRQQTEAENSGPKTPSWLIPYGEESEMDWKDIDWKPQPAPIRDPPLSPRTIPCEGKVTRVEPLRDSYIDPKEVAAVDMFGDNPEVSAGDLFARTEQPAEQEIPQVTFLKGFQNIANEALKTLKRRRSYPSYEDRDSYREAKRQRFCSIWGLGPGS